MGEEVLYKVLFDLRKTYHYLDVERCLWIFFNYGIGPRMERTLRLYLYHLLIVY